MYPSPRGLPAILVFAGGDAVLPERALNAEFSGTIKASIRARKFKGIAGETLSLVVPRDKGFVQFAVVGVGAKKDWNASAAELAAANAYNAAKATGSAILVLRLESETLASMRAFGA